MNNKKSELDKANFASLMSVVIFTLLAIVGILFLLRIIFKSLGEIVSVTIAIGIFVIAFKILNIDT